MQVEISKPAPLNALTGLRCFAAVNIVLFHFSNPQWFGCWRRWSMPAYASVSFFILLSGFVLAYNYAGAGAGRGTGHECASTKARFTRLYPIYLLSLLLAWRMIPQEYGSPHARDVLDGHGADAAAAAGVDSGDCDVPEYAGVDDVGRVVLLRAVSVAGAVEAAGAHWRRTWRSMAAGLDAGPDSRHALHDLQSRRHCASRPLELRRRGCRR